MRSFTRLAIAALLLAALACDRRVEPWVPLEQEPAPPEQPVRIPGLSRPQPQVARLDSRAGSELRGQVRLADGLAQPVGGVLFVIARSGADGPPLAVKRLPPGPFPLSFSLGPDDVMIQGRPFRGPILLSARVDQDGDPLSRSAGDLSAELDTPVEPGASDIDLVLR